VNDDQKHKLEVEVSLGENAERAFETYFEPYFEAKTLQLFEAFKNTSIVDEKSLMIIKQQAIAIDGLRDELKGHINTGVLASRSLSDEGKENE